MKSARKAVAVALAVEATAKAAPETIREIAGPEAFARQRGPASFVEEGKLKRPHRLPPSLWRR
jgi:hypothetical protein